MEILVKIVALTCTAAVLVLCLWKIEARLQSMPRSVSRSFLRSLLFAILLTPTAYHHAPNTIVAPLHLSTMAGSLFYQYDYTLSMFVNGVLLPILLGWGGIFLIITIREMRGWRSRIGLLP